MSTERPICGKTLPVPRTLYLAVKKPETKPMAKTPAPMIAAASAAVLTFADIAVFRYWTPI